MLKPLISIVLIMSGVAGCDRMPSNSTATVTPVALHFRVKGMTCGGCEKSIEHEVADLPSVTSCKASHESGSLTVQTTDPTIESKVLAAVTELQFTIERSSIASDSDPTPGDEAVANESAQPAADGR